MINILTIFWEGTKVIPHVIHVVYKNFKITTNTMVFKCPIRLSSYQWKQTVHLLLRKPLLLIKLEWKVKRYEWIASYNQTHWIINFSYPYASNITLFTVIKLTFNIWNATLSSPSDFVIVDLYRQFWLDLIFDITW